MSSTFTFANSGGSGSIDWFHLVPVMVALFALFVSIYSVYLSKQNEIRYDKFKHLCLGPVIEKLKCINENLCQLGIINTTDLFKISNDFSDLNILFIQIKTLYPRMDIDFLQDTTNEFTDKVYESVNNPYTLGTDFLITKNIIFHKIYDFALHYEMTYFRIRHR